MKNKVFYKSNAKSASKLGLGIALALAGVAQQAQAHVEYYDLNQGAQIGDLTAAGKAASTAQYGETPAAVLAVAGSGLTSAQRAANGIGAAISAQSDRPLNDPNLWNATNQSYTGVGSFSNVNYTSAASSATVDVTDVTDFGWGAGTQTLLGDSHKVDFFNFRLDQTSTVTIKWNVDSDGTYIDSAFTLYSGVLNYQAHDDASDKANPSVVPTGKVQDVLDSATAPVDAQGIASSFRDTSKAGSPGTYVGQFNALANWGQSNVSGNWGNIAYLAGVNANASAEVAANGFSANAEDTLETLVITLTAGNYTIAASGALGAVANSTLGTLGALDSFGLTNLHGHLEFSASVAAPVPVPGAVWLFGTVLAGFVGLNRRKVLVA
ncbi:MULTISPECIES: PEP-CTERM sorting domain-containing protein [unclassified Methylomonas]|uniref:PEP-CTERM sorting domain-containing protein n=1 Tax=unclassified Methylomonas TaxID=2608980 RepID=UPI0008DA4366|nr:MULTISPECIES: PEP-CTERM sorting domain-containing protein [unclassified Methylomonas]OHX34066.1 hypothetical protein BJL95_06110 [Methylomonas sp. LWB]WGS84796.1 PEP-CTERM sorting domain-containing protein [Methylomonas sp. UP202]